MSITNSSVALYKVQVALRAAQNALLALDAVDSTATAGAIETAKELIKDIQAIEIKAEALTTNKRAAERANKLADLLKTINATPKVVEGGKK